MNGLRLACFWPGLAAAWYRGTLRSLCLAILCAWAICLLLLATFVWPEWMALGLVRFLWLAAILGGMANAVWSHWTLGQLLQPATNDSSQRFELAQTEYLKGNWLEAEAVLMEVIHSRPRDAEALLLLVSVLRHTKRWQPAVRRLNQLKLLETAAPWQFEIAQEERLIQQRMAEHDEAETQVEVSAPHECGTEVSNTEECGTEENGETHGEDVTEEMPSVPDSA